MRSVYTAYTARKIRDFYAHMNGQFECIQQHKTTTIFSFVCFSNIPVGLHRCMGNWVYEND